MSRWPIPKDWLWVSAVDIAAIIGGGTPSTKNPINFAENGIPWITPADLSNYQDEYIGRGMRDLSEKGYNSCGAQLMPKDTVLFTSRAPVGYCALAANEICTNQGFKSLVLRGDINPKYIRHYLLYSKEYAESLASGSTFKELSGKRMATLEFPIPPLNEQKRIVSKIEVLQSRSRRAREALETIPDLLEQLRQSILAAAFRGDLTKEWREKNKGKIEPATELLKRIRIERRKRWEAAELEKLKAKGLTGDKLEDQFAKRRKQYKEPEPVDTTDLPELPEGWCWTNWNSLSDWITYGFTRPMPHVDDGPLIVTAKNVIYGAIDLTDASHTTNKAYYSLSPKDRPKPGDILITKDGTIGRAAIVYEGTAKFCINQSVAVIWLRSSPVIREFLLRIIESPQTQEQIKQKAKGIAIRHLSITDFAKIALPLPPLKEQEVIADNLTELFAKAAAIRKSILAKTDSLIEMDESVLFKAFQGKLVPQDPSDEPASILLERIRKEKARQAVEQKVKSRQGGKKMKRQKNKQKDILTILQDSSRPMTPEDLFVAGGFDEDSVDTFYEQLRAAVTAKKVREKRRGAEVGLEASP